MSAVVGIDLSTRALDLVKLDESSNRAEWVRVELEGANAWERTMGVRDVLPAEYPYQQTYWEDVYLVAIEAPYGRGQAGTQAVLNRVVGAVAASLPARLRVPERCWVVRPDEWKQGLGLKAKPHLEDMLSLMGTADDSTLAAVAAWDVNAWDAYCLALWARDTNAAAVEATA